MEMGIGRLVHIIFLPICEFGRINAMNIVICCLLSVKMIALVGLQEPVMLAAHLRINITYYYYKFIPIFLFTTLINTQHFLRFLNICHHFCVQFSPSAPFFPLFFFLDVRLGLLVSNGERGAKLIFFSDSVLTLNDGTFTKALPTLMCLCRIMTLA